MGIKILFSFSILSFCISLVAQNEASIEPSHIRVNKEHYTVGESINVSYSFENRSVLASNFGGCAGYEYYVIKCHSDSMLSFQQVECDELLMEYYYNNKGEFAVKIQEPGKYSIILFVKNKDEKITNDKHRFSKPISSIIFNVIKENK